MGWGLEMGVHGTLVIGDSLLVYSICPCLEKLRGTWWEGRKC